MTSATAEYAELDSIILIKLEHNINLIMAFY